MPWDAFPGARASTWACRAPRERPFSWSLYACSRSRRRSSHSGKRCGASSCGGALRRARVAPAVPARRRGLRALWLRASPAVRTSREMGPSGPARDDRPTTWTAWSYGAAFYRSVLGGRSRWARCCTSKLKGEHSFYRGSAPSFDDPVHEVSASLRATAELLPRFTVGGPFEDKRLTTLPAYKLEDVNSTSPDIRLSKSDSTAPGQIRRNDHGTER